MTRLPRMFVLSLTVTLVLTIGVTSISARNRTFQGKVIDFDTKKTIEGAVVVAYWIEATWTPAGEATRLKEVKECLTDYNGEWSIVGEEGHLHNPYGVMSYFISLLDIYYTEVPLFKIFKPGYEPHVVGGHQCSLLAYAYSDSKRGLEGIAVEIYEKEAAYLKKHREQWPFGTPFMPAKDPESKLRTLDFPFDYSEGVERESIKGHHFFYFKNYTVAGLRKLTHKEERRKSLLGLGPEYPSDKKRMKEFLKKQIEFLRVIDEERNHLGLDEYGYHKELTNEK